MLVDLIGRIHNVSMLSKIEFQTCSKPTNFIAFSVNIGYFGYYESLKTYIEIISFAKLNTEAKKGNQIIFEKLILPKK